MTRPVLGLDIGGANLKAAHTSGAARSVPFALWRDPAGLEAAVRRLVAEFPAYDELAVTMTGELCDCFASKREGVNHILDAVEGLARTVRVWTNEGEFVDVPTARRGALKVASANWLALATFAGRFAPKGETLLIDIGTTTTDVVLLTEGRPSPRERTDPKRLESGELLYRGWRRTPLCAIIGPGSVAELFATMLDVCLVLDLVPEDASDRDTADGQPATREWAERRLARMMCADLETSSKQRRLELARDIRSLFQGELALSARQVAGELARPPKTVLVSGSGAFLLTDVRSWFDPRVEPATLIQLDREELGDAISAAGCAYAVAVLALEREG